MISKEIPRRSILHYAGLLAGGLFLPGSVRPNGQSPVIAKIDVFPVRYPMTGRFKFFEGPEGSPAGRPAVTVKITTDTGRLKPKTDTWM
ncbi:hypothetical protein JW935_18075 [candidate division KSB1 bacterium]|nr:hypothetical protein [candidate division KSB1 bacterium]